MDFYEERTDFLFWNFLIVNKDDKFPEREVYKKRIVLVTHYDRAGIQEGANNNAISIGESLYQLNFIFFVVALAQEILDQQN